MLQIKPTHCSWSPQDSKDNQDDNDDKHDSDKGPDDRPVRFRVHHLKGKIEVKTIKSLKLSIGFLIILLLQ